MKVYCLLHEVKTSYFLRSLQITVERKALIHYHVPESYLFPPVKILCQQLQLWSPLEYDCDNPVILQNPLDFCTGQIGELNMPFRPVQKSLSLCIIVLAYFLM